MTTLRDILENIGYKGDSLQEVAKLLYLTGGIDGIIKEEISKDDSVPQMLNEQISINEFNDSTGGIDGIIKIDEITKKETLNDSVPQMLNKQISINEFNNLLQKNYFKKFRGGFERQQIKTNPEIQKIKDYIIESFDKLGFVSAINPSSS